MRCGAKAALPLLCALLLAAEAPGVRPATQAADAPFAVMMAHAQADAALQRGDLRAAEAGFRTVLAATPHAPLARRGLADTLLRASRPADAKSVLEGMDAPVLHALADLALDRTDRPEDALPALFEATGDARLLNALGAWLDDRGRGERARQAFARANGHQRAGLAHNNIGMSFLREGQDARAMQAFERAVAAAPDDALFARNARLCALRLGDYNRALQGLRGEAASPLLREAGAGALARGDAALATLLLERARDLAPRHDPRTAALLQQLHNHRADPHEHAQ